MKTLEFQISVTGTFRQSLQQFSFSGLLWVGWYIVVTHTSCKADSIGSPQLFRLLTVRGLPCTSKAMSYYSSFRATKRSIELSMH